VFDARGLHSTGTARIPGVVDRDAVEHMAATVWDSLAARGIDRRRRQTWPTGYLGKHQTLRKRRTFDAFGDAPTSAIVDELLGAERWRNDAPWGPALVTFPEPGPWAVPHRMWHFDLPARGNPDELAVVRLFGYVTDIAAGGGATVVVEGSHELVRRMVAISPTRDVGGSAGLRRRLSAHHPWFRALLREGGDRTRQFMVDGDEIDCVRVRVVELTAEAGDVVVMLPWTMHSLAMNCAAVPRFMVTQSIYSDRYSRAGNAEGSASKAALQPAPQKNTSRPSTAER
jgi:hypothetical protein